ncbi:MAG: hypothetical protein D6706_13235 [Chloroflexi bacterium]|nr:MAG: hypothetical protein D6706_13235 [Chloroflexota bacterium]
MKQNRLAEKPQKRRKGCVWTAVLLAGLFAFPFVWRAAVKEWYGRQIYSVDDVPAERVAIVFGAAVYGNGRLSSVLRDRVETAVALYHAGRVQKIIVSGDNSSPNYNEPAAMMAYAIERGVPPELIQPDYGGRRTYDTCYRARHIFGVESAVLITQEFHLPRAIFTCQSLGIEASGVGADLRPYRGARWYEIRETAATLVALWDVIRKSPPPVLGEPISLE